MRSNFVVVNGDRSKDDKKSAYKKYLFCTSPNKILQEYSMRKEKALHRIRQMNLHNAKPGKIINGQFCKVPPVKKTISVEKLNTIDDKRRCKEINRMKTAKLMKFEGWLRDKKEFLNTIFPPTRWNRPGVFVFSLVAGLVTGWGLAHSPELLLVPKDTLSPASVPLKIWAKTRQAVLRPTTRDLRIDTLMALMGYHFDPDWMSFQRPQGPPPDEGAWNRSAVARLRTLADKLPLRESLKEWLISRATCPVRYAWKDLGEEFWPRWLRTAECPDHPTGACSWPPGMRCVPAPPRHLHVLKWHCRLRKNSKNKMTTENNILIPSLESSSKEPKNNKKKRKRYRCMWVKVPYPVSEDCQCGCDGLPA